MKKIYSGIQAINVESVLRIFKELENRNHDADCIYVICDNASYYHSRIAKEYVEKSRIKMVFLPPYSPNLNIIERLWKFFKKKVVSYYYSEFSEFKMACADFFQNLHLYKDELETLLTDNFQMF